MNVRALLAPAAVLLLLSCSNESGRPVSPTPPPVRVSVDRGPYLQATTSSSVTIVWRTAAPADSIVEYGTDFARRGGEAQVATTTHAVTLTGLTAGTSYAYRLHPAGSEPLGTAAFATAPGPDAGFAALVFGDSGDGKKSQLALASRMNGERFDLVLHMGDVIYPDGREEDYDAHFFAPYQDMLRTHPIFPTIGNHDLRKSPGGRGQAYQDAFHIVANNPEHSKLYYSFEWGDAKFISLETDLLFKKPGPHLAWLESELASNERRWLVVFMHVPLYSSGPHAGDEAPLRATVGPLLEKYRVDLVLTGHEHLYERSGPVKTTSTDPSWAGWPYIVTGGGGVENLYPVGKTRPTTLKAESMYHYVLLDFSRESVRGKTVRIDGTLADEFTIAHK